MILKSHNQLSKAFKTKAYQSIKSLPLPLTQKAFPIILVKLIFYRLSNLPIKKNLQKNQIYTNLTKQLDKVQLIIAIKDTEIEEYTKIQKKLSFLMKIYSKECLNLFQKQFQYKTIT